MWPRDQVPTSQLVCPGSRGLDTPPIVLVSLYDSPPSQLKRRSALASIRSCFLLDVHDARRSANCWNEARRR